MKDVKLFTSLIGCCHNTSENVACRTKRGTYLNKTEGASLDRMVTSIIPDRNTIILNGELRHEINEHCEGIEIQIGTYGVQMIATNVVVHYVIRSCDYLLTILRD